ncbi:MAG: hypothetical protein RL092_1428, partial [Bacteroidota bacterium]
GENEFVLLLPTQRESSSVGRARPCQGRGREFEPRLSLKSHSLRVAFLFLYISILNECAQCRVLSITS